MTITRRGFLGAVGAGVSALAGRAVLAGTAEVRPLPERPLGRTGVAVPVLGAGLDFDMAASHVLLRRAVRRGVGWWDTAATYANGNSEVGIGRYFKKFPDERGRVFLVTKSERFDPADLEQGLRRSLDRMRTDRVDLFMLHGVESPSQAEPPAIRRWAEQAKAEGRIRLFGFSTHNAVPCMTAAASTTGFDVVLFQHNYRSRDNKALSDAIDACVVAGIGLAGMKFRGLGPMGESAPSNAAPAAQRIPADGEKLKAALSDRRISCVLARMQDVATLDAFAAVAAEAPIAAAGLAALAAHAEATRAEYCDGCRSCEPEAGVPVADVMRSLMYLRAYGERDRACAVFASLPDGVEARIAACDSAALDGTCPRGLPVGRLLREACRDLGRA
jgi:predicted aldo/keto reductase-like oxidoreductase